MAEPNRQLAAVKPLAGSLAVQRQRPGTVSCTCCGELGSLAPLFCFAANDAQRRRLSYSHRRGQQPPIGDDADGD